MSKLTEQNVGILAVDYESELALLGSLVSYPAETVHMLGGSVNPELFVHPAHRDMLSGAAELLAAGAPLNIITLTQKLGDLGRLEAVGGHAAVTLLSTKYDCTPTIAAYHLDRLRDKAALRLGLQTGAWLSNISTQGHTQPSDMVAGMMERMEQIRALMDAGHAPAFSLGSLKAASHDDRLELLKARFLCRGGGLLLVGPTGVGKSSLSMQMAVSWALGRPCFGIVPARPLRSLIIQAENDEADMAEMRDGVFAGMGLSTGEKAQVNEMIYCIQEDARSGPEFFTDTVEPLLRLHPGELVWLDPALAYVGGDASSQVDVGRFLRNLLNPLLRKYGRGAVVAHHSNKPSSGREKNDWSGSDLAYLGSGSAEWANWSRGVIALRGLGVNGVFDLCLGKRGGRVGWRNDAGQPIYSTPIAHAKEPGRIYWRNADAGEVEAKTTEAKSKTGAPKRFTPELLLSILGGQELTLIEWQKLASSEHGMSRSSFFDLKSNLETRKKIGRSKVNGKWFRTP